jgi:DNA-binding MarR family transcriptional regulator
MPDDVSPLTDEQLATWAALATLLERLPAALDAQLQRDSGLTHFEHGVLFALDRAPDRSLRLSVLAGYANATLSRLSRAVTRLEAKGWVRRVVDPTDGRFTLGTLTDAGHDLVVASTPAHHALVADVVFGTLGADGARRFGAAARRIAEAIDPHPVWSPDASPR